MKAAATVRSDCLNNSGKAFNSGVSRILLETLTVTQLVKKFSIFSYSEQDESSSQLPTLFL